MRRWFAVVLTAVFLAGVCLGCAGARRVSMRGQTSPMPTPVSVTPTIPPTPAPTSTPTGVPGVDAPWYAERNRQIKQFIRLYDPQRSEGEIDDAVRGMFIDPGKPMVALTFDDGPMPGVTDQILDILEQYNARATFFVCGWRFKKSESGDMMRRAAALGCEIGNHTWGHRNMEQQNFVEKQRAIENTNKVVFDETGFVMHDMRPPGGSKDWDVNRIARENGMAVVLWTQSGNVHEFDPKKVAQNVFKQIVNGKELQDGDIILLHDTHPHMVDAVKIIVPQLIEKGYQLVTVWELLNCSEEGFHPGKTYRRQ